MLKKHRNNGGGIIRSLTVKLNNLHYRLNVAPKM